MTDLEKLVELDQLIERVDELLDEPYADAYIERRTAEAITYLRDLGSVVYECKRIAKRNEAKAQP